LRIVASQDVGQLGPRDGAPVVVAWRWHYVIPDWPLWALLALLLVAPRANRRRQAWLILVPLGLVLIVWRMPATLLSMSDGVTESLGFLVVTGVMGWSMVWLLVPWLALRNRFLAFLSLSAVMLAVGLLSFYCNFADADGLPLFVVYCLCVLIALLAMMITSLFCRKRCSLGRFLGWLIVWNVAATMGLMLVYGALMALAAILMADWRILVHVAMIMVFTALLVAGVLYALNLPFLILAFKSPFYGDRLERIFRVERARAVSSDSSECPAT
jgi:hypothetical protein